MAFGFFFKPYKKNHALEAILQPQGMENYFIYRSSQSVTKALCYQTVPLWSKSIIVLSPNQTKYLEIPWQERKYDSERCNFIKD